MPRLYAHSISLHLCQRRDASTRAARSLSMTFCGAARLSAWT